MCHVQIKCQKFFLMELSLWCVGLWGFLSLFSSSHLRRRYLANSFKYLGKEGLALQTWLWFPCIIFLLNLLISLIICSPL